MEDSEKTIVATLPQNLWPGWKTVRKIGEGSYGAVYEIERSIAGFTEKAALKLMTIPKFSAEAEALRSEGYTEEDVTQHFLDCLSDIEREYAVMAQIRNCENIVKSDDLRKVQHSEDSGWNVYIRMELLTGLTDYLSGKYPGTVVIPDEEVIKIGKSLCNALAACEKHRIIHRDIKPQNILVSEEGVYKLGDFGTARTFDSSTGLTGGIGTKNYMSPEVAFSRKYDGRADIYSVGIVMYWLLNERRLPFLPLPPTAPSYRETSAALQRRLEGETISEPAHGSEKLKAIVMKACAFERENRFNDAQEMLDALESLSAPAPVKGEDVEVSVDISSEEASRGCRKEIQVPRCETAAVNLPAGIKNGQTVRVPGKGNPGSNGGPAGDLIVKVRVHEKEKQTPEELYREGLRCYEEKNYGKALVLFSQAANGGNPDAMYFLGLLFEDGKGADSDCSKALIWYEKAAAAGNTAAMNNIGNVYSNGKGIKQDYAKAKEWFEKSAAAGNATAMENLGWIYQNDFKDYLKAKEWYEKSVAAGNEDAKDLLDKLQKLMDEKPKPNDSKPPKKGVKLQAIILVAVAVCAAVFSVFYSGRSKSLTSIKSVSVGDIVTFGSYEQDNRFSIGAEDIEWQVLDVQDGKALLISRYALDCQPYNKENTSVTWETCSLRKWLNEDFYNSAFSADEQAMIETTKVTADKNPEYSTDAGNATMDKVFLLSISEAEEYFSGDEARKCAPTAYAKAQGAYTSSSYKTATGEAACWWWLRSPGNYQFTAASVSFGGSVYYFGHNVVYDDDGCVRPALWVNLNS